MNPTEQKNHKTVLMQLETEMARALDETTQGLIDLVRVEGKNREEADTAITEHLLSALEESQKHILHVVRINHQLFRDFQLMGFWSRFWWLLTGRS